MIRDAVWTGWRREALEQKQEARRKLRSLLRPYAWREWTRPCIDPPKAPGRRDAPYHLEVLVRLSLRD